MERLKNNLHKSVLSFYHVGPKDWVASPFNGQAVSQVQKPSILIKSNLSIFSFISYVLIYFEETIAKLRLQVL